VLTVTVLLAVLYTTEVAPAPVNLTVSVVEILSEFEPSVTVQ